jgi:ferredoxin
MKTKPGIDFLRVPLLGKFLLWRWGRLLPQLILFAIALLAIYDGFTGPQLAPANAATVLIWVDYRGVLILALLFLGNLFCFACPFTLPRTLAHRISAAGRRWPDFLRNKWVSIAVLFLFFWIYELFDLWADPILTAWLMVIYFILSFLLEACFSESPFCKYVCPLGAFNFLHSTISPLQVTTRDREVCRECPGKECVNGSKDVLGCGTELFVPTIRSNMDCTLCLDCARACPYGNVSLVPRRSLEELTTSVWRKRWDLTALAVGFLFIGLMNAFGMVPPVYALQEFLYEAGIQSEALRLLLIFGSGILLLPLLGVSIAAWMSRQLAARDKRETLKAYATRYAPTFVPAGFGIWLAHYGFHFAIGGLTIAPVLQTFLLDHGLSWLGAKPNWELSYLIPAGWIFPLQILALFGGYFGSLYVLGKVALRPELEPVESLKELIPWAIFLTLVIIASLLVFNLPMEMRGTIMMGT